MPLCQLGFKRSRCYSVVKKQKERGRSALNAQKRPAPLSLFRTGSWDFGSGIPLPLDQRCRREQSENNRSADCVVPMVFT